MTQRIRRTFCSRFPTWFGPFPFGMASGNLAIVLAVITLVVSACHGSPADLPADSEHEITPRKQGLAAIPSVEPAPTYPTSATARPTRSAVEAVSPTPRPTPSPTFPSPTPTLHREWSVLETTVEGKTVTVDLHMYAAVDVRVALGGRKPELVEWSGGSLRHVFREVPAGNHEVEVSDVTGSSETFEVVVPDPRAKAAMPSGPGSRDRP